jgi:hypothetical protein
LQAITIGHDCFNYVKNGQEHRGEHKVYMSRYDHYLGTNNVAHMAARADQLLQSTVNTGETKRWSFEKYLSVQKKEQHRVLEGLRKYGNACTDEEPKSDIL